MVASGWRRPEALERLASEPDVNAMTRAVDLAARGLGRTTPNPAVGAVLVRDGEIVGEGNHAAAGAPHAEVVALRGAGDAARGATLYVTLEPCCHHGRTPPCTDAILSAGVAEVRYAVSDPDPRVAGRGHQLLEAAGVDVLCIPDEAAAEITRGFVTRLRTGRPWVTVKVAMSVDGKVATRSGDSRWISGPASRRRVHALRDRADAVLVGIGTALADDPLLTVRPTPPDGRQPLRIVLDSALRLPHDGALSGTAAVCPTLVAYVPGRLAGDPEGERRRAGLEDRGIELLALPPDGDKRVSLEALATVLGQRGSNELLVEGGADVVAAFLAAGLVDELLVCVAPVVIGGRSAPGPVGGVGVDRLELASRFEFLTVEQLAGDVWLSARPADGTRGPGGD
jgi:diaminohydroxyphosphoribosylaminopyrimidine deaminase/5-amino-6-(5-phosphoribosylamino)uracil reductase